MENPLILTAFLFSFLAIFGIADLIMWLYLKVKQRKIKPRLYLGNL